MASSSLDSSDDEEFFDALDSFHETEDLPKNTGDGEHVIKDHYSKAPPRGHTEDTQPATERMNISECGENSYPSAASKSVYPPLEEYKQLKWCSVTLIPHYDKIDISIEKTKATMQYELTYRKPPQTKWLYVRLSRNYNRTLTGVIDYLRPGVKYEFLMKVRSKKGLTTYETMSLFTNTRHSSPPSRLVVRMTNDKEAVITWNPPYKTATGVFITGYNLQTIVINPLGDNDGETKYSDFPLHINCAAVTINPAYSYKFVISAHSNRGISQGVHTEICWNKHNIVRYQSDIIAAKGMPMLQVRLHENRWRSNAQFRVLEFGYPRAGFRIQEKVILVIGATGAGKTTLINSLINYVLGVEYSDPYRFKIISEVAGDQSQSQTKNICTYTIHCQDGFRIPFTLTIIDTPGFGDTEGIARDKLIAKMLFDFFKSDKGFISHVDVVGFVANASVPRLSAHQQYIFDSILSLFGKDIGENIYLLLTFADGKPPQIMSAIKKAEFPHQGFFKFNNSAILNDIGAREDGGADLLNKGFWEDGDEDEEEDDVEFNKPFWDLGMKSFEKFMNEVKHTTGKSLKLTKDVMEQRERIEIYIEELHRQVQEGLMKQEQLIREEQILRNFEEQIDSSKNFTYQVMEPEVIKLPIPDAATTTTCLKCNYTCHESCIYDSDSDKHKCWAMNDKSDPVSCRICPNRCVWHVHKNTKYHYVTKEVWKTKTSNDLKARYEEASGKHMSAQQLIDATREEFEGNQGMVMYAIVEIRASLAILQNIALKDNPLSTVGYIDILIHTEKAGGRPGWQARLEHLQAIRERAHQIQEIAKGDFDPFEAYREQIEQTRKGGANFKDMSTWAGEVKKFKPRFLQRVKQKMCSIQ